jgi:wyosine [tRNA(Phe)-imidazoG37] synthetase (radical SAM superfamily)
MCKCPPLDAASRISFLKINRPDKNLNIKLISKGLIQLRNEYKGKIYLKIFVVPNINDTVGKLIL